MGWMNPDGPVAVTFTNGSGPSKGSPPVPVSVKKPLVSVVPRAIVGQTGPSSLHISTVALRIPMSAPVSST